MKTVLALLFLLVSIDVHAIGSYSFAPANPRSDEVVSIRIDVTGCLRPLSGAVTILPNEPAIEVRYLTGDLPCEPSIPANTQTPRFQAIGTLPAGHYTTRMYFCDFGPVGTTCDVFSTSSLIVQGVTGTRVTVPAVSNAAIAILLFLVAMIFGVSLRR